MQLSSVPNSLGTSFRRSMAPAVTHPALQRSFSSASSRQVLPRRNVASRARKEEATGGEYRTPIIVRVIVDDWLEYLLFAAYSGVYFFLFKLAPEGWGWPLFIFMTVSQFTILTLQRMRLYE